MGTSHSKFANPQTKDWFSKLQFVTGTIDLTNDFKVNLAVQTSDAKAAEKLKTQLNQLKPLLGLMAAGQQEQLGPVINKLVEKIDIKQDDKNAVTVSLIVTEDMLKQMSEGGGGGEKTEKKKEKSE